MIRNHKYQFGEHGQSLIELSISLLFILIILGAVFDLGAMFYTYLALRDTAQEGMTYGSFNPTDESGIELRIHAASNWPIDADQISNIDVHCCSSSTSGPCNVGACTTSSTDSCQGQKISVQLEYDYELIMPVIGVFTGWQDVPLQATVTNTILESKPTAAELKLLGLSCP